MYIQGSPIKNTPNFGSHFDILSEILDNIRVLYGIKTRLFFYTSCANNEQLLDNSPEKII